MQHAIAHIPASFSKARPGPSLSCTTPWSHNNLVSLTRHLFMWPPNFYWHFSPIHWAACRPGCSPFPRLQKLTVHMKKKLASNTFRAIRIKETLFPSVLLYLFDLQSASVTCPCTLFSSVTSLLPWSNSASLACIFSHKFGLIKRVQEVQ